MTTAGGRTISLSVLSTATPGGKVKPSRVGVWRALVLFLVNAIIAARLAWWLANDQPAMVTPVEPSESLAFSKDNVINAGLIFFLIMIVSTMVFGRFFCGWACHFLAVQDACRWLLLKVGIRPKPFRSRMLALVPLGAFLYMFIWPLAYRGWLFAENVLLRMGAGDSFSGAVAWANSQPFAFSDPTMELVRTGFWDTFPGVTVAILSFVLAGGLIVYVLGSKGFCFYACPYGGIFGPVDRLSPVRIRVNEDCDQSGHCTSVCSSNVRVHEEVRDYGMVVDSGCMKCMDCVSVCPNDALRLGFGKPAIGAKPRRTPDIRHPKEYTGKEELALAAVFLVCLYAVHGLYGVFPFLVSLGLASILAFVLVSVGRMAYRPTVRAARVNLKLKGKTTGWGRGAVAVAFVLAVFLAHSVLVQYRQWVGSERYAALASVRIAAITGGIDSVDASSAAELEAARDYIEQTLALTPFPIARHEVQRAWLTAALGDIERFEREAMIAGGHLRSPTPYYMDVARTLARGDRRDGAWSAYEEALDHAHKDEVARVRAERAEFLSQDPARMDRAMEEARLAVEADAQSVPAVLALARLTAIADNDFAGAIELLDGLTEAETVRADEASSVAMAMFGLGEPQRAAAYLSGVMDRADDPSRLALVEADVLLSGGDTEGARAAIDRLSGFSDVPVQASVAAAQMLVGRIGDLQTAETLLARALETSPGEIDLLVLRGDVLDAMGRKDEARRVYATALDRAVLERRTRPEVSSLWFVEGGLLARLGRFAEAEVALEWAVELSPGNLSAWGVLGNIYAQNGKAPEAEAAYSRAQGSSLE